MHDVTEFPKSTWVTLVGFWGLLVGLGFFPAVEFWILVTWT